MKIGPAVAVFNKLKDRSGVYCIRNLVNGKRYIGSAIDLGGRFRSHYNKLKSGKHSNIHLQRAWKKYGLENFSFRVIQYCQKEKLLSVEQRWMDYYDVYQLGYNRRPKAESNLGVKWPLSVRSKMGWQAVGNTWALGRVLTEKQKEKLSQSHLGKKHTKKSKKEMSKAQRERYQKNPISEETKLLLSERTKAQLKKHNHWLGRKHTAETCEKISIKATERQADPEFRKKMSLAVTGFKHTEETKLRMRGPRGPRSAEHTAHFLAKVGRDKYGRYCLLGEKS